MARRQYNIKWRSTDEDRLRRAISKYNARIKRMEETGLFHERDIPVTIDFETERDMIRTRKQYNTRMRQIERIQNYTGSEASIYNGKVVPTFAMKEAEYAKATYNRASSMARKSALAAYNARTGSAVASFEEIPGPAKATILSSSTEQYGDMPDYLGLSTKINRGQDRQFYADRRYINNFVGTMDDLGYSEDTSSRIKFLMEELIRQNGRGALVDVLAQHSPETDIGFLYTPEHPSKKEVMIKKFGGVPYMTLGEIDSRQQRLVQFWEQQVRERATEGDGLERYHERFGPRE